MLSWRGERREMERCRIAQRGGKFVVPNEAIGLTPETGSGEFLTGGCWTFQY
jgi:hypothetical protein